MSDIGFLRTMASWKRLLTLTNKEGVLQTAISWAKGSFKGRVRHFSAEQLASPSSSLAGPHMHGACL